MKSYPLVFTLSSFFSENEGEQQSMVDSSQQSYHKQMHRKNTSALSIEEALPGNNTQQQYLFNLKAQCKMQEEAFQVAESLISTYKKDNLTLREQVAHLKDLIKDKEYQLSHYQEEQTIIKTLEKNILKYSQRVNQLLQQNLNYEQQIRHLERELDRQKQDHLKQRQYIKDKLYRHQHQENQKKQLEGHFKNFLRLAEPESSQNSPKQGRNSVGKQSFITAVTKDSKEKGQHNQRVLQWKVKQRDEQILILLKRLKNAQQNRLTEQSRRRERVMTSDCIQNYHSKKKNNISEFTH